MCVYIYIYVFEERILFPSTGITIHIQTRLEIHIVNKFIIPLHLKHFGAELGIAYLIIAKLILQRTEEHHH
jgi:hypothetical protein